MENLNLIAFEIIASSGDAMNEVMIAMDDIEHSQYEKARKHMDVANKHMVNAHKKQTELLVLTAQDEKIAVSVILVHAQDHLMNVMLAISLVKKMISIFERKESNE